MSTPDDVVLEADDRMSKTVEKMLLDLRGIRTGRANPALLDVVRVDYYGTPTPLKQIASVGAPEPQLLMIKPFDPSALSAIEKGVLKADLGLSPQSDGKVLRIPIPPLSQDRRKQLAGVVKQMGEQARIALRNVRHGAIKEADALEEGGLPEDAARRLKDSIQEMIQTYEKKVQDAVEKKQGEITQL